MCANILLTAFVATANILLTAPGVLGSISTKVTGRETKAVPSVLRDPSVRFFLYTRSHSNKACLIDLTEEALDQCDFNTNHKIKILIHGWNTHLKPDSGHAFDQIKDALLKAYDYNVVIVDWSDYDNLDSYLNTLPNISTVGKQVADLINFLVEHKGVSLDDVHLIAHSLGCPICANVGTRISNLGRITGLDPAGPMFGLIHASERLTHKHAKFVDIVHGSNHWKVGYGLNAPTGMIDFYVNGGEVQPLCQKLGTFVNRFGELQKVVSFMDKILCNHELTLQYFRYSIQECEYLGTQCEDYDAYKAGKCSSHPVAVMGLPAHAVLGLKPKSTFYVKTTEEEPFCKKNKTRRE